MKPTHNHPLRGGETLRYLKPKEEVKKSFLQHFESGLGPSAASREHGKKIAPEEWISGRTNPPIRVVQNWHKNWRTEKFGSLTNDNDAIKVRFH